MAVLQGDLSDYSLPDFLQFLRSQRKNGYLLIEREVIAHHSASIYYREGRILHASCPPRSGREALYALLEWTEGRFVFLDNARPERITITEDLDALLLEGLRRHDEFQACLDDLPPLDAIVYRQRDRLRQSDAALSYEGWTLLELVNGHLTVGELIDRSLVPPAEAARCLQGLIEHNYVCPTPETDFLGTIIPQRLPGDYLSPPDLSPPSDLAIDILSLIDGHRDLEQIAAHLPSNSHDFIDTVRQLVRQRFIEIVDGFDTYLRYLT